MKMIGKKKRNVLGYVKHILVGCLMSVVVCAVAFAADPTELLGDDFGIKNVDEMVASVTVADMQYLVPYMEDELMARVEYDEKEQPNEFLDAYLDVDETFVFTLKRYYEGNLA